MRTTRFAIAATLSALIAVALVAQAAGDGKTKKYKTEVTENHRIVDHGPPPTALYRVQVDSDKSSCKARREVIIVHESDPPFEIARGFTDKNGRFEAEGPYPPKRGEPISITVKPKKLSKRKKCRRGALNTKS